MKKTKKSTSKARQSARASVARSNSIKAIFIVAAFILVGVGVVSVQKAQIYKSQANDRYNQCLRNTGQDPVNCGRIFPGAALKFRNYLNSLARRAPPPSQPRSNIPSAGGSTSGGSVASSGHSVAGLVIPTPVPHCTPIRTAPVLTSPSGHLTSNGAVSVSPGSHPIKWTVAAGQKGGVVVIDDKSNPASSSCNHLNNGDACRVPESKGRTNTVSYNFKRGKKYNIRVTTINCGTASTASRQLKVEVANPSATPIPSTPGISTTPTP